MLCQLNVVTLNTWGLPFPLARPSRGVRFPRVASWLQQRRFDVVALQEVWNGAPALQVPGLTVCDRSRGDAGLASACSLPVLSTRTRHFRRAWGVDALKSKGLHHLEAALPSGDVLHVINTHLQAESGRRSARARAHQVGELLHHLRELAGPALVMGDFNLHHGHAEDDAVLQHLHSAGLRDVMEPTAHRGSYLGTAHRFDRIFTWLPNHSRLFWRHVAAAVEIPEPRAPALSDHHPVSAVVELHRVPTPWTCT